MPGRSGEPVVTMLVCFFILHARLRVHQAPGFPAPSDFHRAGFIGKPRTHRAARMRSHISQRHCEPTGRANARPMTGSAKQSILSCLRYGLLRSLRSSQCRGWAVVSFVGQDSCARHARPLHSLLAEAYEIAVVYRSADPLAGLGPGETGAQEMYRAGMASASDLSAIANDGPTPSLRG